MSTNNDPAAAAVAAPAPVINATPTAATAPAPSSSSFTEALTLRRNLLASLYLGVRQLPRGRRLILLSRIIISFAQIIAFIPLLSLPGSHRVSPSHETGRVCNPASLFNYLVVHIVRLALDIPVELYLGLSPHRTRAGRNAGPEQRAIAERDRPLGSEYLDVKVGKLSTLLGIASLVIFFVGNAIVYSSTECSQRPAEAVPLFWGALASLIVVYIFIFEIAVLAFLIVCALPLLMVVLRALGLQNGRARREINPETGKIGQEEVDKRVKLVYYTPAEEETAVQQGEAIPQSTERDAAEQASEGETTPTRPDLGSRRPTQETITTTLPALNRVTRLTRILVPRRRRSPIPSPTTPTTSTPSTISPPKTTRGLKYPLHPLPAHRATCPICLCDFEEPSPGEEPEPEPLRLLECGHVMHRGCVDQWLTTVSGRCPVCQKAVIPEMQVERAETVALRAE
uniref:RING-type domain-containing protein n=1 Tax=Kalmanozyma brasiliensis (strain GHG001) TaxID=1365824 RepID=V5EK70_KALBG